MSMTPVEIQHLKDADRRFVWHPFTQMQEWEQSDPVVIERGEGVWLFDIEGRKYLDGVASLWTNVHGHGKREIDAAITAQLGRIAHSTLLGLANVPSIQLAERLVAVAPRGLAKVFYSDNGSTAVEVALKMAFQFWRQQGGESARRTKFIAFSNAYHGDTLGAVAVGGIDLFHAMFRPLLFQPVFAEYPYPYRSPDPTPQACRDRCLAQLAQTLKQHEGEIAAVLIEPLVQAAAGMIAAPKGFLHGVADLARQHGALLILDEIATGFGRTGCFWACDHEQVSPDLLCTAKGLTAGYMPLAATLATQRVYDGFLGSHESRRTFFHGHTFTGNPLGCAAALASLDCLEREHLIDRVRQRSAELDDLLARLVAPLPCVGDIRGYGLMRGVELVADRATKQPFSFEQRMGQRVILQARRRGVFLRPLGNTLVIFPPLSISADELRWLIEVLAQSIQAATATQL